MSYITREYDDNDVIQRLKHQKPEINFGEGTTVDAIDLPPREDNATAILEVTLRIRLTSDQLGFILANPI